MDEILNDYLINKVSILSLSKKYNLSYDITYRFLKSRTNIISNRERYSKANHTLFENIMTEEDAYWLGFLYADGNVYTKNGKNTISLSLINKEHVEKFKSFIGVNNKIYDTSNGAFSYQFSSVEVCNNLKKYGLIDRKSTEGKLNFSNINSNLMTHLWRGIIDGDGWVLNKKFKNRNGIRIQPVIGLCGTLETCQYLLDFLTERNIKFSSKIRQHKSIKKIQFSDSVAINIIELLYGNSKVHLDRKKETSNQILKNK
jgi:hypothetical protein